MTLSPAQFQQACDLINRSDGEDRMDDAPQKCKVGKLCNGRCIPQNHQCVGQHPDHDPGSDPKGSSNAYHNKTQRMIGLKNGVVGGALAGAGALAAAAYLRKPGANNEAPPPQNQAKQAPPQNQAKQAPPMNQANEEEARKQRYEKIKKEASEAEQKNGFGKKSEPKFKAEPRESAEDFYKRVGPDIEKARQEAEAKQAAKGPSGGSKEEQAKKVENEAFKKHLSENPEKQAIYNKAIKDANAKYGMNGAKQVHKAFKDNWRKQSGSPDPKAAHDENWHKTLGVAKDASASQIKKAYRDLSKKHHPDKGGNADKFNAVKSAYESSKNRKDAIDRWQSIELAYQSAQKQHPLTNSYFWAL